VDRYGFRRILHTSLGREKLRSLADFRPISVTPILSRVVEESFVQKWLKCALPDVEALNDQYATNGKHELRCSAHLTNALIVSLEALSKMFTSCLLVDFTRAFDTVDHVLCSA
jgi:hypothetical protein